MPTGYTQIIEDKPNVTLREYALRCVRNFGFCMHMRDEPIDAPPRPPESDPRVAADVDKARAKLVEVQSMSVASARPLYEAHVRKIARLNAEFASEHAKHQAAYSKMRAAVEAWSPPTKEHEGLKTFMLSQIDLCYRPDEKPYMATAFVSAQEWLAFEMKHARDEVEREEERARNHAQWVADGRTWFEVLCASLPK